MHDTLVTAGSVCKEGFTLRWQQQDCRHSNSGSCRSHCWQQERCLSVERGDELGVQLLRE
jgi:hypothetical protein